MKDDILTYREMCDTERVQTLQRGMNFRLGTNYSVLLMSQRTNAPYNDHVLNDGMTIIYEGHDVSKTRTGPNPKTVDQQEVNASGSLTQNGKFAKAVRDHRSGAHPEIVKVYEKLLSGVWSFKGFFSLIDYALELSGGRRVFKFKLRLTDNSISSDSTALKPRSRIIPTEIKKTVWERDRGKCVICGATDELHFDHDIPYAKGGASITPDNIKILCARHNLQKRDKIE